MRPFASSHWAFSSAYLYGNEVPFLTCLQTLLLHLSRPQLPQTGQHAVCFSTACFSVGWVRPGPLLLRTPPSGFMYVPGHSLVRMRRILPDLLRQKRIQEYKTLFTGVSALGRVRQMYVLGIVRRVGIYIVQYNLNKN